MKYQLSKNSVNGINIPENSLLLSITDKMSLRLIGDNVPYCEGKLEDYCDNTGAAFTSQSAFINYFNLMFVLNSDYEEYFNSDATYYYYAKAPIGTAFSAKGWNMYRVTIALPNQKTWALNCIATNYATNF